MGKTEAQEYLIAFGQNLQRIREENGLSQRGLASLCKIDHSDISKMERGEKNITILTILELATALDVKPRKLLDF